MALKPLTYEDLLFQLLRDANIKKFNARKSANPTVQLADCDFAISTCADCMWQALILAPLFSRRRPARHRLFQSHARRRQPQRRAQLRRAISADLAAEVIALSVDHGTRLRYDK